MGWWRRQREESRLFDYRRELESAPVAAPYKRDLDYDGRICQSLVRAGWTVARYRAVVESIAEQTLVREVAATRQLRTRIVSEELLRRELRWLCSLIIDRLWCVGADEAAAWAAVLTLTDSLTEAHQVRHDAQYAPSLAARWFLAAGDLGPLAYAAGLSSEEATQRKAAGTLDRAGLMMLAGLRGHPLLSLPA